MLFYDPYKDKASSPKEDSSQQSVREQWHDKIRESYTSNVQVKVAPARTIKPEDLEEKYFI